MASFSDSLAAGSGSSSSNGNWSPGIYEPSFLAGNSNSSSSSLPLHHNFHASSSGRRRRRRFSLLLFLHLSFFWVARALAASSLLPLPRKNWSCLHHHHRHVAAATMLQKLVDWYISHILTLRARRILQYVITGQTDTMLWARPSLDILYDNSIEVYARARGWVIGQWNTCPGRVISFVICGCICVHVVVYVEGNGFAFFHLLECVVVV